MEKVIFVIFGFLICLILRIKSKFLFILSVIAFFLFVLLNIDHPGFAFRLIVYSYGLLVVGSLLYLMEIIYEKK